MREGAREVFVVPLQGKGIERHPMRLLILGESRKDLVLKLRVVDEPEA